MKKLLFLLISMVVVFASCKKDAEINEPLDFGYNYFPLKIGDSSIYIVKNIFWNDFDNTIDTTNYFLCEYIESATTNLSGDSLFRIERMKRDSEIEPWNLDSVWFALRTKNEAIRVENNYSYVKLVFPTTKDVTWNSNAHNHLGEKQCTLVDIANATVNGVVYNSAVFVDMERFQSLINSDVETEIYVPNIGLVQVDIEHVYLEFNSISGAFEITSGYRYSQIRIR